MAEITFEAVTKRFEDIVAVDNIDLHINHGEFFCIVGPSGSGKTTVLRMIAGLEHPTEGTVKIGDETVNDQPPQDRNITMVFQDLALFPHMTVRENIGFSLNLMDEPNEEVEQKVTEAARMVQIEELLDRSVNELSGGQQQRVALARSSVRNPKAFLLDEPLSDLDAKLKVEVRGELQRLHQKLDTTMVYVTHDQEEAMTMSDRIAVMHDGKISQVGKPNELYHEPANVSVAKFIGMPKINLFRAELNHKNETVVSEHFSLEVPQDIRDQIEDTTDEIQLGIRPEKIDIELDDPDSALATARVVYSEPLGATQLIHAEINDKEIRIETDPHIQLETDQRVGISFDIDSLHFFDHNNERVQRQVERPISTT